MFIDYVGGDFPESRPHAKYESMRLGVVYKTAQSEKSSKKKKKKLEKEDKKKHWNKAKRKFWN